MERTFYGIGQHDSESMNNLVLLSSKKMDVIKWQTYCNKFDLGLYSHLEYLNAVTQENWEALIWGDYEFCLPVYIKKKWGFFSYISMPPFCQQFQTNHIPNNVWEAMIAYLAKSNIAIDIRHSNISRHCNQIKTNYRLVKGNRSYENLSSNYSSRLQRNLSKSDQPIIDIGNIDLAYTFFRTIPLFEKLVLSKYQKAFEAMSRLENFHVIVAKDQSSHQIVGALGYLVCRNTAYIIFPYQTTIGKKQNAMTTLIDHIIRDSSIEIVDFEGSSIDSIAQYYAQFGAESIPYSSYKYRISNW